MALLNLLACEMLDLGLNPEWFSLARGTDSGALHLPKLGTTRVLR